MSAACPRFCRWPASGSRSTSSSACSAACRARAASRSRGPPTSAASSTGFWSSASSRRVASRGGAVADQPVPFRRYLAANAVALAPSFIALLALHWSGYLAGRPTLIAMAGIAVVTVFLVQRYPASLALFARFVGELSDEREPVMPRLSFASATEELATAAAMLSAGWRRQRASIDNLAASAQAIVDGLPDPLIAVDRQRRIVGANLASRQLLGSAGAERDLSTMFRQPQLLAAIDGLLDTADGNF